MDWTVRKDGKWWNSGDVFEADRRTLVDYINACRVAVRCGGEVVPAPGEKAWDFAGGHSEAPFTWYELTRRRQTYGSGNQFDFIPHAPTVEAALAGLRVWGAWWKSAERWRGVLSIGKGWARLHTHAEAHRWFGEDENRCEVRLLPPDLLIAALDGEKTHAVEERPVNDEHGAIAARLDEHEARILALEQISKVDKPEPEPDAEGWRPMDTAPRDGTEVMLHFKASGVTEHCRFTREPYPWASCERVGLTWDTPYFSGWRPVEATPEPAVDWERRCRAAERRSMEWARDYGRVLARTQKAEAERDVLKATLAKRKRWEPYWNDGAWTILVGMAVMPNVAYPAKDCVQAWCDAHNLDAGFEEEVKP